MPILKPTAFWPFEGLNVVGQLGTVFTETTLEAVVDLQPLLVLTVTVYVCVPDATGVAVVLLVVEAVTPLPDQL